MVDHFKFYIDGAWTDPVSLQPFDVINPANEEVCARIALGSVADVDRAVEAARKAFESFSQSTREERIALLSNVLEVYKRREQEVADVMTLEMGAPKEFALVWQAGSGTAHLESTIEVLKHYEFERLQGTTLVMHEAIGVVGMITPWNWPINQIVCKVAPALAAGCTMVLKPSEIAPLSGIIWAEIMHEAGVPKGVFNLVQGDGPTVGAAIAAHPGIDMVSFTGSTRGGIALIRPLVDAGFILVDYPITVNAVSGYSGGGKSMIEAYEAGTAPSFELYGLGLAHKHVPELQTYSNLTQRPIFVPSVGNFRQGMLVSVPLHLDALDGKPKAADLHAALVDRYEGCELVRVVPMEDASVKVGRLEAESLNNTDMLELRVYANESVRQAVLVAKLDNLGKGASGAAVQNLKLMLGVE